MIRRLYSRGSAYFPIIIAAIVIVMAISVYLLVHYSQNTTSPTSPSTTSQSYYCVGRTFAKGSSGPCVSDIQMLVNYMESSGLTECPFQNGATLSVSGNYDSMTALQVLAVQRWASCYAKQEGFTSNISQTGNVDKTTWGELCTYGYIDPLHTSAKDATQSIAAGNNAGCATLKS